MKSAKGFEKLKVVEQLSFAQTSAWWHPNGTHFSSNEIRDRAMSMVEEIVTQGCKQLSLERASGVIPKGVAGHLATTQAPSSTNKKSEKLETLRLVFRDWRGTSTRC